MTEVDVRGLSCPLPVVKVKKVLDSGPADEVRVIGDSAESRENVSRLARSRGYEVSAEEAEDGYRLVLSRTERGR